MILVPEEGTPKASQLASAIMDPFATQSGSVTSICISCIQKARSSCDWRLEKVKNPQDDISPELSAHL